MSINKYVDLITSQHIDKQKFVATVTASVLPFYELSRAVEAYPGLFDVDTAVGQQLDVIGEWAGVSRNLSAPLLNVYFTWDDTAATGWDNGIWRDVYDPDGGLIILPDDSYRLLIKAKIAANSWDGTIPSAYSIWTSLFPGSTLFIQDNQTMSMIVGIVGVLLSAVDQALLVGGYIPLKPAGVRIEYYAIPPEPGPIFGWDVDNSTLAGWETGQWPIELIPTN